MTYMECLGYDTLRDYKSLSQLATVSLVNCDRLLRPNSSVILDLPCKTDSRLHGCRKSPT